jgi:cyclopropane-fatty-acyl-phospholipid synthase
VLRLSPVGAFDRDRSQRNIQSHYDVGNDFYALFLDENMGYTCGYRLHPDDTSEQMQDQKHALVCRKLGLNPGERIADLGCGFGGMLRYAAKHYGISGVGCTLSEGQVAWATHAIEADGLQDRIRVELKDYRDMAGIFDKVVSIGMAEHAWENGYGRLMEKISSLLSPGGIGLVHTIGSSEDPSDPTDPWIRKYIFPGGRIPRLLELTGDANAAGFTIAHIENLKPHYAETLRLWREKFHYNRERILALGPSYNERFLRMWDYYLQSCEAAFRFSSLELYQMLFYKGERWTLPWLVPLDSPGSFGAGSSDVPGA